MTLKSRAERIFKVSAILLVVSVNAQAGVVRRVAFRGCDNIPCSELSKSTLIHEGRGLSSMLIEREMSRIDSLYFSKGFLGVQVAVDTNMTPGGIEVVVRVSEGERARVGKVGLTGVRKELKGRVRRLLGVSEGDYFDSALLERGMRRVLSFLVNSGYPYAQVWLTGFSFERKTNSVEVTVSIVEGNKSIVKEIVFEGLSRTDSSFAVRLSRLKKGGLYSEEKVEKGVEFLSESGYFESVSQYRIERNGTKGVKLIIPVKEKKRINSFQGVAGLAKKDDGYILNGSIDLRLKNIAGSGRNASFNWLSTGERFSSVYFSFFEPFIIGSPFNVMLEVRQTIQDSTYTYSYGGLSVVYPIDANNSIVAGVAVDRNLPGFGELLKSTRQRYKLGIILRSWLLMESCSISGEAVLRNRYYSNNRGIRDYEAIYTLELIALARVGARQSFYARLKAEGVASKSEIPIAEKIFLGGANSLRGYRENQFRGDDVLFSNFEYRFGRTGAFFLFDDVGAFYIREEGWKMKNGAGFGMRSYSPLGELTLSFGVGDRISFEGTKIHVSLRQSF